MSKAKEIGDRIAQARREKGVRDRCDLRPVDVARALKVSGASVSDWEAGKIVPREELLQKLAGFLGVTPEFLRYGVVGTPEVQPIRAPDIAQRPKHHEGATRVDVDAARERVAKRDAAKKQAVAGDRPHPTRRPKRQ